MPSGTDCRRWGCRCDCGCVREPGVVGECVEVGGVSGEIRVDRIRLVVLVVLGLLVGQGAVGAPEAVAAERRWTGGGASERWSDPDNWSEKLLPVPFDTVKFPYDAARAATVNDLAPGIVYSGLELGSGHALSGNSIGIAAAPGHDFGELGVGRDASVGVPIVLRSAAQLAGAYAGEGRFEASVDLGGHELRVGSFNSAARFRAPVVGGGTVRVEADRFYGPGPRLAFEAGLAAELVMEAGTVAIYGDAGAVGMDGGTLAGRGRLRALHAAGGRIHPDSGGVLEVVGEAYLGDDVVLAGDLGGTSGSTLRVEGNVVLDSPRLQLAVADGLATGQEVTIIDNAGASPIQGTFADLVEGSLIGQQFGALGESVALALSYRGGDGNDITATVVPAGYHIVLTSGATYTYGRLPSPGTIDGSGQVTGAAARNANLWAAASNGEVVARPGTAHHGDARSRPLQAPIVAMAATPGGGGYWLAAADGGVFAYGDAGFYGSAGGLALQAPIVAMAATPDGGGYWLVAADGGVFAYGDAGFFGSAGGRPLQAPIVAMAATPDGGGYWLVAADGGVFAYGDAGFFGANHVGGIASIAATPTGAGYWLVRDNGWVDALGDAPYLGSPGGLKLDGTVTAIISES